MTLREASAPRVYSNVTDALLGEALEEFCGGLDGGVTVRADAFLMAVMKQNVCASVAAPGAVQASLDVGEDSFWGNGLPVVTHRVPLDELEA